MWEGRNMMPHAGAWGKRRAKGLLFRNESDTA